jgi:hypothetical protein
MMESGVIMSVAELSIKDVPSDPFTSFLQLVDGEASGRVELSWCDSENACSAKQDPNVTLGGAGVSILRRFNKMRARTSTVFPKPISSARMPPLGSGPETTRSGSA